MKKPFIILLFLSLSSGIAHSSDVDVDVLNFIPITEKKQILSSELAGFFVVKHGTIEIHINRSSICAVNFFENQSRIYISGPAYGVSDAASALMIPTSVMNKKQVIELVSGKSSWW